MSSLVDQTAKHVERQFRKDSSGHDWWHIYRVWQLSKKIAAKEQADMEVCELGALLHDIADFKFHGGDTAVGPRVAREWLAGHGADKQLQDAVCHIVENVSFKGAKVVNHMKSMEGKIVQDADRLDAMGAIGMARAFAYNGYKGNIMHDPDVEPVLHASFEEYKKWDSTTINHFYEKLLLLKSLMNTDSGKRLAEHRHRYMEDFLAEFYQEWEGVQ